MSGRVTATEDAFEWESLDGAQTLRIEVHGEELILTISDRYVQDDSTVTLAVTPSHAFAKWIAARK